MGFGNEILGHSFESVEGSTISGDVKSVNDPINALVFPGLSSRALARLGRIALGRWFVGERAFGVDG